MLAIKRDALCLSGRSPSSMLRLSTIEISGLSAILKFDGDLERLKDDSMEERNLNQTGSLAEKATTC